MFFDTEDLSLKLLNVIELDQRDINILNVNRPFDALSFRICAHAHICTQEEQYFLGDGSICYVPAHLTYRRIAAKDKLIVIHFDTLNYSFDSFEWIQPENPESFHILFSQILACWSSKEPGYYYRCTSLLHTVLEACTKITLPAQKDTTPIAPSVAYLKANFTDPNLTVGEIAAKSYISQVYFRKLFKEIYHMSPAKYIITLRINRAIELMHTEYYPLHEIAALCGYRDYAYFSSEFKRIKGTSPSGYLLHKKRSGC